MSKPFDQTDHAGLKALEQELSQQLQQYREAGLKLDLTRGKPGPEQLSLSDGLDGILQGNYRDSSGTDLRNYGGLDGIPEAKALFAEMMGVDAGNILVGGNSSLTLMYFAVLFALHQGVAGSESAWAKQGGSIKFLAPVPGYDRHFSICEQLGIEMIPVALGDSGPDMDEVERLVAQDPMIKGIWCVPRFSNPSGCVYSSATVKRLAGLPKMAGPHFRVLCDNAYAVHSLEADAPQLDNVMASFEQAGTADALYLFGSTSKITFAGAGVAFVAMTNSNLRSFKQQLVISQIGPDKVNQLRHVRLLRDMAGIERHMQAHAALLKPRFDIVLEHLHEGLGGLDIATWTEPKGGYFVSFDTRPRLAQKVVELAASAGVVLTPAGATHPYGKDPQDTNIRLAPSFPSLEEIDMAMQVFVCCVKLATVQQLLS
jgi:DNA-binding transcriptional MocR family regulator